jgi:hypothetical protein
LSKDRWIGAYSIGLTISGKLVCPIKKEEKKNLFHYNCKRFYSGGLKEERAQC